MLYLIYDNATGQAVSSSQTPNGAGAGQTSVQISDANYLGLLGGWLKWDPITRSVIPDPLFVATNAATLQQRATTALATNATFLAGVAARRTAIATDKATAITGQSATVANVAAAQTQIRSIWTVLTHVATALDDLNNQIESGTRQNDGVIRLLLGLTDSITDA